MIKFISNYKNWSNINFNLDPYTKSICGKPLSWRPTNINYELFNSEMDKLTLDICKNIKSEIDNNYNNNPWKFTKLSKNYYNFKNFINNKFDFYKQDVIKNGIKYRNKNTSKNQLILLKRVNKKYPNLKLKEADKNRGNVIMDDKFWDHLQISFINKNKKNYKKFKIQN